MNNKQLAAWNNLRFGNQHPKHIRKHFTEYFLSPIKNLGFQFTENKCDHKVIVVNQKHNWYLYNKQENMAFMEFKYIKPIETFFVVNQEDHDFSVHIGWFTDEQSPIFSVHNNHNNDDIFCMGWSDSTDDSKRIGIAWAEFLDVWIFPAYTHKKRTTKWLTAVQEELDNLK